MERELLEAIGVQTSKLTPFEVYELAGKAIHDAELTSRAQAFIVGAVMPKGSRAAAIAKMSPAERLSLRERVSGVVRFKK
jgi:hypothetical protein